MLIHCGTIQSHTHADRVKRKKLPFTSNESFSKHFQYRREYNSFKIMSSCFNSVFHNFKSFRNYADISYVNAPYQMHVFSFILFLFSSLTPLPIALSVCPLCWFACLQQKCWLEWLSYTCCTVFRYQFVGTEFHNFYYMRMNVYTKCCFCLF